MDITDSTIPNNVREKVEKILRNQNFSEQDGDRIKITKKDDGIFYGFVKSEKRGSFGQVVISEKDLSFLWGGSAISPEVLFDRFKSGVRSMPHQQKNTRRSVKLPVIKEDKAILDFADKMTKTFISLFDEQDVSSNDPLNDDWYKMIRNALVLLLSAREKDTKLMFITMLFHSPNFVKTYLKSVKDREAYEYWTKEVPKFMQRSNAVALVHYFDLRIASLIGEQEIQDLCHSL